MFVQALIFASPIMLLCIQANV